MWGTWSRPAIALGLFAVSACGAADNRVDPSDLTLRDLLGMSPQLAHTWDDDQRAAARHVIESAFDDARAVGAASTTLASGRTRDERIARSLAVVDGDRAGSGAGALALVRVSIVDSALTSEARRAIAGEAAVDGETPATAVELWLSPAWDSEPWAALPGRGVDVLGALAADAGHTVGPIVIVPSPRLAVAAAYVAAGEEPAKLLVNPVLLASLEPDPLEGATVAGLTRAPAVGTTATTIDTHTNTPNAPAPPTVINGTGGNPYAWYGSVAECAFVQRTRCEACLPGNTCTPVTDLADGNAECTMLAADGGRGYFLLCINLSLAIASVDSCTADEAPACPRDPTAGGRLSDLNDNANFLDDPACAMGLDRCLADIYGAPPNPFPDLDGGTAPPDPPRDINVSCGDSCNDSNNNGNCEASPSCSCSNDSSTSGPSCGNAFSCDSACSSSNEQSGCGGNCEACNASNDSGGSTSAGCGGCESDGGSTSGGGGSCDSCSSDSGGSSGGGSCDSCSSDSGGSSGGGSCGGDSCGGGSSGGGDSCGSSGGSGGSCNVQRRGPPTSVTLLVAGLWGFLPVPAALLLRRKARKKKARAAKKEVV